jgi:peroxiredoxin
MDKKPNRQIIIGVSVIVGICLICCIGIGITILNAPNLLQWSLEQRTLEVGSAAPDFELTALDGKTVRLSQFKGQPILLSFGATWCPGCCAEAPLLQEVHENHPELIVLLVNMEESPQVVQEFASEVGITHPILLDRKGRVSNQYRIYAIPTSFFIDAEGIIQAIMTEEATSKVLAKKLPLIGIAP